MSRNRPRAQINKRLLNNYLPPEGVPLRFEVAGLGARFGAQVADILLSLAVILATILLLALIGLDNSNFLSAVFMLMFFGIRVPYYVLSELLWNGQTLGKRMMGLRVISTDGRQVTAHALVVRNLTKEGEVFGPGTALLVLQNMSTFGAILCLIWIIVVLAVPLLNSRRQRLGDMIAGTYVVNAPRAVLLPELARGASDGSKAGAFVFEPRHLNEYGAYELQTLERLLQAQATDLPPKAHARRRATLISVGKTIRDRIGYHEEVAENDAAAFLNAFYQAQRAFLENRQLFGERRKDKFHKPRETPGPSNSSAEK